MVDSRRILRIGARSLAAVAGAAAAAAVVLVGASVAWPEHRVDPPSEIVQPSESRQQRVCPGPLLDLGADPEAADATSTIGTADTTVAVEPADVAVDERPLTGETGAGETGAGADDAPIALTTGQGEVDPGMLAGAQLQRAGTSTVRGLAAVACGEAADESWLVGGSTALGRTTLVLLANPGTVSSTVDLRIFGRDGAVDAPGASGIVVPAGTRRVVALAGLAPDEPSPVVHVLATGAPIAASLEQTVIRGLAPGGVDLVGPGAAPSTVQVVPGAAVPAGGVAPETEHADGDGFAAVRLFVPGAEDARASVRVLGPGGDAASEFTVDLKSGVVADVPLGELPAGVYTVVVEADAPVLAAVRIDTGDDGSTSSADPTGATAPPRDLAWAQAAAPLGQRQLVAVAGAATAQLLLANPGDEDRDVRVAVDGGDPAEVRVPAGGTAAVPVTGGAGILLEDVDGLSAAVVHRGTGLVAVAAVQPPGPLDSAIRIYPR